MHAPLTQLFEHPERFGYFQALRLLLLSRPQNKPPPSSRLDMLQELDAVVQLGATSSSAFPPGEIHSLEAADASPDNDVPLATFGPSRRRVNFLGLTGPSGVLPLHYTEWLAQRRRAKDDGPAAFLDMFNHRALLLFWQAWARNRPGIMQELTLNQGIMRHVHDLIGMGTRGLRPSQTLTGRQTAQHTPATAVLGYYSGLISQRPHSSTMLAQIISDTCQAPVQAEACLGTWQTIPAQQRTQLGAPLSRLGQGLVLGQNYWDRQTTLRLSIGPLNRPGFDALLPGGGALERMVSLLRFLTGTALDLRIQLKLDARELVPVVLNAKQTSPSTNRPRLGWNTWLTGRRDPHPAQECEFHFHATGGQSWR